MIISDLIYALARKRLDVFIKSMMHDFDFNWHHELIIERVTAAIEHRGARNLIVTVPPRHGKSEIISRMLPAFVMGKYPEREVMTATYSQALSTRMNRDVQALMRRPTYASIFPDALITRNDANNAYIIKINGTDGSYYCTSVGGSATGMGYDIGIIDDPLKNYRDANSEAITNGQWNWFVSTMWTRRSPNAVTIILTTRWSKKDLVQRVLDSEIANDFEVLELPALATETSIKREYDQRQIIGEPLWPAKFSTEFLESVRKLSTGTNIFQSLYQCNPIDLENGLFKPALIKIIDKPNNDILSTVRAWDFAATQDAGDFTVSVKMGSDKYNNFYILDVTRDQIGASLLLQHVYDIAKIDGKATRVYVPQDPGAAGKTWVDTLVRLLAGWTLDSHVVSGSKEVRALPFASQFHHGNVYMTKAPWNAIFIDELREFPQGTHDDQVDAASDAFAQLAAKTSAFHKLLKLVGEVKK